MNTAELCNFLSIFMNVLYVQSALKMVSVLLFEVAKKYHINNSSVPI